MYLQYPEDGAKDGVQDNALEPRKTGSGVGVKIVIAGLALSVLTAVAGTVIVAATGIDGFVASIRTTDREVDSKSTYDEPRDRKADEPPVTVDPDPGTPAEGDKDPDDQKTQPKSKDSDAGPKPPKERSKAEAPKGPAETYPPKPTREPEPKAENPAPTNPPEPKG